MLYWSKRGMPVRQGECSLLQRPAGTDCYGYHCKAVGPASESASLQ